MQIALQTPTLTEAASGCTEFFTGWFTRFEERINFDVFPLDTKHSFL